MHGQVSLALLMIVVWLDAGDGQRAGDTGQRSCRLWSASSLPPRVSCRGEGEQVAGVLQLVKRFGSILLLWLPSEGVAFCFARPRKQDKMRPCVFGLEC
jgi:hypothetical protein